MSLCILRNYINSDFIIIIIIIFYPAEFCGILWSESYSYHISYAYLFMVLYGTLFCVSILAFYKSRL